MVTWKKIQSWGSMSGKDLAVFWAKRGQDVIEVELQGSTPGQKLYLLPGWEREPWEYASWDEARRDWALMIVPREAYREKFL